MVIFQHFKLVERYGYVTWETVFWWISHMCYKAQMSEVGEPGFVISEVLGCHRAVLVNAPEGPLRYHMTTSIYQYSHLDTEYGHSCVLVSKHVQPLKDFLGSWFPNHVLVATQHSHRGLRSEMPDGPRDVH